MIYHIPKSLESVTHITEKEHNLFMYFFRYSQCTEMLSDVLGALWMEKNFLFWISANHNHPDGPKSAWLNSTKEIQRFPESCPSLCFYFFFRETMIQGILLWKGPPKLCLECHLVPLWAFPPKSPGLFPEFQGKKSVTMISYLKMCYIAHQKASLKITTIFHAKMAKV